MAISKAAIQGASSARAVQFQGLVQDCPVHILIDSGSSASFLSSLIAQQLSAISSEAASTSVQVAGGGILHSPGILHQVPWSIDQYSLSLDFRTLLLSSYDVIIGMDWLETHSPMQVH